jgi:DNA-binding NtrC family response regulator
MPTRVLLVDDDAVTLQGLSELLSRRLPDIEIQGATSAERALILMALERFDIILSDVRMPGMDGLGLLQEIRNLSPETLVILMSGCEVERRDEAIRLGAWSFVEKPFVVEHLVALLGRAIAQCHLASKLRKPNYLKPAS